MGNDLFETLLYLCSGGQAWDAKLPAPAQTDAKSASQPGTFSACAVFAAAFLLFCQCIVNVSPLCLLSRSECNSGRPMARFGQVYRHVQ